MDRASDSMPETLASTQLAPPSSGAVSASTGRLVSRGITAGTAKLHGNAAGFAVLITEPTPLQVERTEAGQAQTEELEIQRKRWMVEPPPVPEWARDPEWAGDMESVWRARMAEKIAAWSAIAVARDRAARSLARAEDHGGTWDLEAPGIRNPDRTRAQRRAAAKDEKLYAQTVTITDRRGRERRGMTPKIIVCGPHGSSTSSGRRVELLVSAEHAEARARAASMTRQDIVGTCGKRWMTVGCGCARHEIQVGCDQTQLCERCRKTHWKKWRKRIVRAMTAHLRVAVDKWHKRRRRGRRPGIYLITLTMPHSGDLVTDRRKMGEAWRDLSKRASYGGYQLGDGENSRWSELPWWGHHALVYEATDGAKHDGHLHAHVAVISPWVPYKELRAQWQRSIPGAVVVDVIDPDTAIANAKRKGYSANGPGTAANYLAKYVTKGVEPREMSGRKAGELLVAFAGRRKVTTSRYFWRPLEAAGKCCAACSSPFRLLDAPIGLQEHAPAAVWRSMIERTKWKPPPARPQVRLRW